MEKYSEFASPPIFIIGCGRSGTTIFGTALSKHSKVTYLNEPRDLWFSAYPETDIWTWEAQKRQGKMVLTAADEVPEKSRKLRNAFFLETVKSKRPVLIEKLPINNFRLSFIRAIFPEARFIHIYRNGLEVAGSIGERCTKGGWFSSGHYKWDRLAEFAASWEETARLPSLCADYYHKGLLEWRLSTKAGVDFLSELPETDFFEISYAEFVSRPVETISSVLSFIGIDLEPRVASFVTETVERKTRSLDATICSDTERAIGGELLELSLADPGGEGLTSRLAGAQVRAVDDRLQNH